MDINESHEVYGHLNIQSLKITARNDNIKLTGNLEVCQGCNLSKEKRKVIKKVTNTKETKPGELIFVNTSGPYTKTSIGSQYWFKTVDDYSLYSWSDFGKSKDELPEKIMSRIKMIKSPFRIIEIMKRGRA